ncbi:MAG: hypothetical protein JNK23_08590 [Opitutaceae bacterium]|nr:hypothetical protein [Opitutaceae bacterium]
MNATLVAQTEPRTLVVTVSLAPSELGLYAAVRHAKRVSNDAVVSAMVAFCLQLLAAESASLTGDTPLDDDLERAALNLTAELKRLGSLLAGAEKILLDAAALRDQLARYSTSTP